MLKRLRQFMQQHQRILVLTGAGVSTASGIPAYRDEAGQWQHSQPMQYRDFTADVLQRQRYWARSYSGWEHIRNARPNAAHFALSRLEALGKLSVLITQNVDSLHQRAGSQNVIDLHGSLDQVVCLSCGSISQRASMQAFLARHNPFLSSDSQAAVPDGDANVQEIDFSRMTLKACEHCQGVLKPNVVFYGENVPKSRVQCCFDALDESDALLVVGSSLMVYSGFRFVRRAHQLGIPVALVNRGVTRADELVSVKVQQDCAEVLDQLVRAL